MWLRTRLVFSAIVGFVAATSTGAIPLLQHGKWSELNIGPCYVYTRDDVARAREDLTQLEQLRWVLGGLLDTQDLPSPWPIRIILTQGEEAKPSGVVPQNGPLFGQIEFVQKTGDPVPLATIAGILLDGNTPRLPPEAESGLRQLLGSIQAHGSRVTWGGPVAHPDLAWARMQLFATKFEYSASFHILVSSLRNGSSLRVAERNAFNRDPDQLEREAAANLEAGHWEAVSVSGRPLDPKRDLGEHSVSEAIVTAYLAVGSLNEQAFKDAIEAGGDAKPLGYEGLAAVAVRDKQDPKQFLENAAHSGSRSAPVYYALGDYKTAFSINPRWALPIHAQAETASEPHEKEELLKKALAIDPRATDYWVELAELQDSDGRVEYSNGSWLRAEDSAASSEERERIHQLHAQKEQERLDAEEAKGRSERDATRLADEKAQNDEMARIHAAEQKANANLDAAAGGEKVDGAVPWQDTVSKHTLNGLLLRVDCSASRLAIKDPAGHVSNFQFPDLAKAKLSCGAQQPARRVTITYSGDQALTLELK